MSEEREILTVRILDKEYSIACLPEERESLVAAASELNERMADMRGSAKVLGAERMAVMAALNVIHEREQVTSRQAEVFEAAQKTVHELESKLDVIIGRRENA